MPHSETHMALQFPELAQQTRVTLGRKVLEGGVQVLAGNLQLLLLTFERDLDLLEGEHGGVGQAAGERDHVVGGRGEDLEQLADDGRLPERGDAADEAIVTAVGAAIRRWRGRWRGCGCGRVELGLVVRIRGHVRFPDLTLPRLLLTDTSEAIIATEWIFLKERRSGRRWGLSQMEGISISDDDIPLAGCAMRAFLILHQKASFGI